MPNRKSIDELAQRTGAPFTWGSLVEIDGFQGVVVEAKGKYIGVIFKEDATETVRFFHPANIKFFRVIDPGKIREWWVKHPLYEWEDIDNLMIVSSSHFMKARYKGWKKADDAGVVTRKDLLLMRSRRKYSSDDRQRWRVSNDAMPVPKVRKNT